MSVAEFVNTDISHLIEDINNLDQRFSVLTEQACKHCGKNHKYVTVNCGTPLYWLPSDDCVFKGPYVEPPEGAIWWTDWVKQRKAKR